MTIKTKDPSELIDVLKQGEQRFRDLGDAPTWSSYRDGIAIADFIERSIEDIKSRKLLQANANELWRIFAPTCDWDDCVGDRTLGQIILHAIEKHLQYRAAEPPLEREQ